MTQVRVLKADNYRARVNPVASLKIKNNLLALTLVFTSLPGSIQVSKAVVEQVAYVIGQYLGAAADRPEVSCQVLYGIGPVGNQLIV